jgi:hypothetical protein
MAIATNQKFNKYIFFVSLDKIKFKLFFKMSIKLTKKVWNFSTLLRKYVKQHIIYLRFKSTIFLKLMTAKKIKKQTPACKLSELNLQKQPLGFQSHQ